MKDNYALKDERDKTKEYTTEYDTFFIVMFCQEEIPKVSCAGWCYKVIDKKNVSKH